MTKFVLESVPIFKNLNSKELKSIANFLVKQNYQENDLISKKGTKRDKLLIINEGLIALENESGQTIALFKKNDSLGEMTLVEKNSRHQYSLRAASEELKTLELSIYNWASILKKNPTLEKKIFQNIASHFNSYLEHANNKLLTLFQTGRIIATYKDSRKISEEIIKTILKVIPSHKALFLTYSADLKKLHVYQNINYPFFEEDSYYGIRRDKILQVLIKEPGTAIFDIKNCPKIYEQSLHCGRSTIITPLYLKEKVLGFIILGDKKNKRPYSLNNKILLEAIAGQVAPVIDYHQNKKLEWAKEEIKKAYIDPFSNY